MSDDPRDDELLARCRDRGFTPPARLVPRLLGLAGRFPPGEKADVKAIASALARGDQGVAERLVAGLADAPPHERVLRLRTAARIDRRLGTDVALASLGPALRDEAPRVVREAARAIGKLAPADATRHLAALVELAGSAALPERRAVVDALATVGDTSALSELSRLAVDDDDLHRRIARASTLIERRLARPDAGGIALDRPLGHPHRIVARCRSGLATIAAEQLAALERPMATEPAPTGLRGSWSGTLGALFGARSVLDFGLEVPLPDGADPATRVIEALMRPDVGAAISAWTDGPPRFRLAWAGGGKRRSLVMRIAQRLRARGSALVNDSREVAWTFEVDLSRGHIVCRPRADPRFTYRLADVPAASHPTVAAALAWVADPQAGDTVWDPFCGSGTELVECAHRSEGLHLRGTDLSADAIAIARRNVEAAHIDAASLVLARGDACRDLPPEVEGGVDVILCNPPLGRRIAREGGLSPLLRAFVDHGAAQLRPGGRIVMLSAQPSVTADAARRSGLHPHDHTEIDMGGFSVALQVHAAPSRR